MGFGLEFWGGLIEGQQILYAQVAGNSYNLHARQILKGQKEIQGQSVNQVWFRSTAKWKVSFGRFLDSKVALKFFRKWKLSFDIALDLIQIQIEEAGRGTALAVDFNEKGYDST